MARDRGTAADAITEEGRSAPGALCAGPYRPLLFLRRGGIPLRDPDLKESEMTYFNEYEIDAAPGRKKTMRGHPRDRILTRAGMALRRGGV